MRQRFSGFTHFLFNMGVSPYEMKGFPQRHGVSPLPVFETKMGEYEVVRKQITMTYN